MEIEIGSDQWVWVVVQDPDEDAQFLGQRDEEKDESFIPTFLEKDHALQCLNLLAREPGRKYEVQAIQYDDLVHRAGEKGFMVFILNGGGEILERKANIEYRTMNFES